MRQNTKSLTLYYCYAPKDKAFCKALEKHLSSLKSDGYLTTWHAEEIKAGQNWHKEYIYHLENADIILLLVSSDLLTTTIFSKEIWDQIFARHQQLEIQVIPIRLRPVDTEGLPMNTLQALPSNGIPVTKWRNRDAAYVDIVQGIRQAISILKEKRSQFLLTLLSNNIDSANQYDHHGSYHATQSIFFFNSPLTDIQEFYGRRRELTALLDRTYKGLATSIVGPRRMGKTWLMQYMCLVATKQFGSRFHIVYIDATSPRCTTITGFVTTVLEGLNLIPTLLPVQEALNLIDLERAVKQLRRQGLTPILCIDEFEGLTNEKVFDLNFFSGLRAIAQMGLALVAVSKFSLLKIVSTSLHTSPFFNIFEKLTLEPFSIKEAENFVNAKSQIAGFTQKERDYILYYGQDRPRSWPPVRLQLVGTLLLEEKTLAEQEDPDFYRPHDPAYWQDFEKRLEEKYHEIVGY